MDPPKDLAGDGRSCCLSWRDSDQRFPGSQEQNGLQSQRCPFWRRDKWDSSRKWQRASQTDVFKQGWWYSQEAKKREACDRWLPGGLPGGNTHAAEGHRSLGQSPSPEQESCEGLPQRGPGSRDPR